MASSKDFTEGGRMTFLTLMGGLLVFGILWLALPRAAFAGALLAIFSKVAETNGPCEAVALLLLLAGVVIGALLDIAEGQQILEG